MRADSGFYNHAVVAACRALDVRFSITIRQQPNVRRLIEAIAEEDWTPIPYWLTGGAAVAETTYTPFRHREDAAPVRLIVRRVKPTPGSQLALFTSYSYHAFITDRAGEMLELEAGQRRHAEIENAIRDLKYGVGLNHLPSGRFAANAAWLAVQVIAHNLARWTARLGLGEGIVTTRTLRRRYFALAGRLTHSARRWTLHLAKRWPWAGQWAAALARPITGATASRPDARLTAPAPRPRLAPACPRTPRARRLARTARPLQRPPQRARLTLAPAPSAPPSRAERRLARSGTARRTPARPPNAPPARQPAPSSFDRWIRDYAFAVFSGLPVGAPVVGAGDQGGQQHSNDPLRDFLSAQGDETARTSSGSGSAATKPGREEALSPSAPGSSA